MTRPPEVQAVLDLAGPEASGLMEAAERRILSLADGHGGAIGEHALGAVAAGGKRLRPLLAILSAGERPAEGEAVVRAAAAVELVHAATLVHDDVLDRAELRRGQTTVVAAAGREMATAVGDLLFAVAFGELVPNGVRAVDTLASAGADLARGELIQRADAWRLDVSEERFLERCELKTARLFEAAASLGAQAGGMDPSAPVRFGRSIGLAFQLLDDVLDVTGPPELTGKPRGADLLDGTVTLPLILAMRSDPGLAELDLRSLTVESAAVVCDRIAATGSLDLVRGQAFDLVAAARAELDGMTGWSREAFELVAQAVVDRNR